MTATRAWSLIWGAMGVAALIGGCEAERRADDVRHAFPNQAASLLSTRLAPTAGLNSWVLDSDGVRATFPWAAGEPVTIQTGDFVFQSFELGVIGEAKRVDNAVTYERDNGFVYWLSEGHGVEEWLWVDAVANEPVASWRIDGAQLEQRGEVVIVSDLAGAPRLRVTAPAAFDELGKPVEASLVVAGDRLSLFVDATGEVLVDPMWEDLSTMQLARASHAAALLPTGFVLVSGGESSFGGGGGGGVPQGLSFAESSAELYNPAAATWTPTGFMGDPRMDHTLTTLPSGEVLVVGGWDSPFFGPNPTAELYDPTLGTFSFLGFTFYAHTGHTATLLDDGRVLICGGVYDGGGELSFTAGECGEDFCELYDPNGKSVFEPTDFMNEFRVNHEAVKLQNGQVLITGGEDCGFVWNDAELYNPATDLFTATQPMSTQRAGHTLTLLNDGRVIAIGGFNGANNALATAEIYEMGVGWTNTGSMGVARAFHTASLLPSGRVLVAGGSTGPGNALMSAEIFDPLTGTFSFTDALEDVRFDFTATTLGSGDILVAGGRDGNFNPISESEVFVEGGIPGTPCIASGDCLSGFCVDGVCCDTACDTLCVACTSALKGSGADGACGDVAGGTDPDGECAGPMCVGDDLGLAESCDGNGACMMGSIDDCGFYTCDDTTTMCLTSCTSHADCATEGYCEGSECLEKKDDGTTATDPAECKSGFVADGVCCDAACDLGVCDACTVAAGGTSDGTCTSVVGDCGDENECTADLCDPTAGCYNPSVLDGVPCSDGVCVAGACVPDSIDPTTTNGAGGNGSGGGDVGSGGDPFGNSDTPVPSLSGGGICQASIAPRPANDAELALLGLGLIIGLARRRGKAKRSAA